MGSAQATLFYGNVSENFRLLEEHQNLFGRTEQNWGEQRRWMVTVSPLYRRERTWNVQNVTLRKPRNRDKPKWSKRVNIMLQSLQKWYMWVSHVQYAEPRGRRNDWRVLLTVATTCEFESLEEEDMRDRIICGVFAFKVWRKAPCENRTLNEENPSTYAGPQKLQENNQEY